MPVHSPSYCPYYFWNLQCYMSCTLCDANLVIQNLASQALGGCKFPLWVIIKLKKYQVLTSINTPEMPRSSDTQWKSKLQSTPRSAFVRGRESIGALCGASEIPLRFDHTHLAAAAATVCVEGAVDMRPINVKAERSSSDRNVNIAFRTLPVQKLWRHCDCAFSLCFISVSEAWHVPEAT